MNKILISVVFVLMLFVRPFIALTQQTELDKLLATFPKEVKVGPFNAGHVQGIAVDLKKGNIYLSFTTQLVKTDLQGNVIGSVIGLLGHLGCLDFNKSDGRVYGSLEYKNDGIGKGILNQMKKDNLQLQNAFYIAIFDVDKIDRLNMDAEKDGVMTTVYLAEPLSDYKADVQMGGKNFSHRFCCSGIDGVSFGPAFGQSSRRDFLTVAYGVYGDTMRTDNDYQVLLQYDITDWKPYERTISQEKMHTNGPAKPNGQYFVFTGNTTYGVQNLEYNEYRCLWLMAVYKGKKPVYPNYSLYAVDGNAIPKRSVLKGVPYQVNGCVVPLAPIGQTDVSTGIRGWKKSVGSTGLESVGNDYYMVAESIQTKKGLGAILRLYRFEPDKENPFVPVK